MNWVKTTIILFFIGSFMFSGCQKYEEGPLVSLQKREKRVANVWKVSKATDLNGKDVTASFDLKKWELTDQFSIIFHDNQTKYFGRWQFTQSNKNLEFSYDNDSLGIETYVIQELKDKELTLTNRESDITIEFIPVN